MLRRVHTTSLTVGEIALDSTASRHARDVLRLAEGTEVEVFDDAGNVGVGSILRLSPQVIVRVKAVQTMSADEQFKLTIASAVPKGERAAWMIEKLSELGCWRFIPLAKPPGASCCPKVENKRERWMRIATESAKQSRRHGVMQIGDLMPLKPLLAEASGRILHLSTQPDALPLPVALSNSLPEAMTLLVGPEGGWSDEEIAQFASAKVKGVRLTSTILRVETAAIAAAAVVMTAATSNRGVQP